MLSRHLEEALKAEQREWRACDQQTCSAAEDQNDISLLDNFKNQDQKMEQRGARDWKEP